MNNRDCATCPNKAKGTCPLKQVIGGVVEPLEARELLAANAIVTENQLAGTPESVWEVTDAGDLSIQGFSTDISVNVGQTISFKVDDKARASYHIEIYRMGYYQGNGARLVYTIPSAQVLKQAQPAPIKDTQTGLIDCGNWAVSASWSVPSNAVSGIYIANLVRDDTGGKSSIYFIVRNDSSHSDLLFQTSDTTWQAYNSYGGNSLYVGSAAATAGQPVSRAVEVSYNRPLIVQGKYGGLDSFNGPLHSEYPMVRWLESNGYDVSYFTGVDADRRGSEILEHEIYLSVGHDEYWSGAQRANVTSALSAGVNLAFFSGNEMYWKVRWDDSADASGTPYRTMVCYKETHAQAKTDPEVGVWTGQWRDPRFGPHDGGLPENQLTGQMFSVNADTTDLGSAIKVPAEFASMRLWRDTSVANLTGTQVATLNANTLGYEWDEDVDNGFRPAGMFQLSSTTRTVPQKLIDFYSGYGAPCPGCVGLAGACGCTVGQDTATHSLTLYKDPSGALVFGAGTVQWSWGLDSHHIDGTSTADVRMEQATVNLFADMHVQPGSINSNLELATASTDATAPTAKITSPKSAASIPLGVEYTITGTATDAGGGVVAGVEVSVDGGNTWHPATGRTTWTYTWRPGVGGASTILARAVDDSGNLQSNPASVNVNTPGPTDQTMFGAATPFTPAEADSGSLEVGTKFRTDVSGQITGVRFYKGPGNTGTHVGNLWTRTGQLLDSVTFTDETDEGWQYALFSAPVSVTAGTTYVVSYYAPKGHYADDLWYFDIRGAGDQQVHALPDGVDGANGVYKYSSSSTFPSEEYQAANYYVDVLFKPSGVDTTPPVVTAQNPAPGAIGVAANAKASATFDESVQSASIIFTIKTAAGVSVAGSVSYDDAAKKATFTPSAALADGTTYIASITAKDLAGNAMLAAVTWSFTTANADGTQTIFGTAVPIVSSDPDAVPIELGVKFTTDVDGTITGVRFYKGTGNAGTHIGNVWTSTGILLASATFLNESTTGWQTVMFASPIIVSAGTVCVASYFAPNGHYAADDNYFATVGAGAGQVHALANGDSGKNGVYRYSSTSAFPNSGYLSTNYWVDVVFTPTLPSDTTPPRVDSTSPAAGATGVATGSPIKATFSESVTPSTISFTVKDASGNVVPGTVTYDDATLTATFTPSSALAAGVTYTANVRATDLAGNAMPAAYSWVFTTTSLQGNQFSIWGDTATPKVLADPDSGPTEVGVKFQTDVAGYVTGIRFYKAATNTGTHIGNLWSADGTLLATAIFTNETTSGWQTVTFSQPVQIQAGTTYVASYHMENGHYSEDAGYFVSDGVDNGPLHALRDGVDEANGVARYGASAFPNQNFGSNNYWVDVTFVTSTTDTTPPTITSTSPAAGATGVATSSLVRATFSESVTSSSISFTLKTSSGTAVGGTITYDDATRTATFTPSSALSAGATYTAAVRAADLAGNQMASSYTWSFTTGSQSTTPVSLFSDTAVPTVIADPDSGPTEVGVKFQSDVAGYVTGIRFYKASTNTGTHIGNLWSADGTLLATAVFTNETASGWQTVTFSQPVLIQSGTTYVASYHMENGHYSEDPGYFASDGADNGPLHALRDGVDGANGVARYGASAFPNVNFGPNNYWVDVLFVPA